MTLSAGCPTLVSKGHRMGCAPTCLVIPTGTDSWTGVEGGDGICAPPTTAIPQMMRIIASFLTLGFIPINLGTLT